jgi:hypothetical protein
MSEKKNVTVREEGAPAPGMQKIAKDAAPVPTLQRIPTEPEPQPAKPPEQPPPAKADKK